MSSSSFDMRSSEPIEVPLRLWPFDLFWGAVTVVFVAAAVLVVLNASTTGGQVGGGLGFGAFAGLCVLGWADVRVHRDRLVVTDQAITRTSKGRPETETFSKAAGADLAIVSVRFHRGARWGLAQPGNPAPIDVQPFKLQDVRDACQARGWQVHEPHGRRR